MKLVGKFKKLNPILPLYIVVGLLCVAIPVRTYQLLFITEASTGFYTKTDWSVYVIYGLAALTILVSFIIVTLAKNVPSSRDEIRNHYFMVNRWGNNGNSERLFFELQNHCKW